MYFALTEVMKPGKLVVRPQWKITSGGMAFFLPTVWSVGTQQPKSDSTAATTPPAFLVVASKNISSVSLHGIGALELRRAGRLRAAGRLALPLRRLLDRELLRVELERDRAAGRADVAAATGIRAGLVEIECRLLELLARGVAAAARRGEARPSAFCSAIAVAISMPSGGRIPWCAISTVSVATLGESRLSVGPDQRTGTTPSSPHRATIVPSAVIALIVAVLGSTPLTMLANHRAIFMVCPLSGRESFTFGYFSRDGSCQTMPLLPPSSRVSSTTSMPRPSQLLNVPRSSSSMLTAKQTLTAGSSSGVGLMAGADP